MLIETLIEDFKSSWLSFAFMKSLFSELKYWTKIQSRI